MSFLDVVGRVLMVAAGVIILAGAVGVIIGAFWPLKDDDELNGRGG